MTSKLNCSIKTAGVYVLYCKDLSVKDEYVGKSIDIYSRIHNHKSSCNAISNKKTDIPLYNFIRRHGGFKDWEFNLLEECPRGLTDKKEISDWLSETEIKWIKRLEPTLNIHHSSSYKEANVNVKPPNVVKPATSTMQFIIMAVWWLKSVSKHINHSYS